MACLECETFGVCNVVHDAPRRAHDDVRPLAERHGLLRHVYAAHKRDALEADAAAERLKLLRDLDRELARGAQHERKKGLHLGEERLNDGYGKGGGFARAGLRECDNVLACMPRLFCSFERFTSAMLRHVLWTWRLPRRDADHAAKTCLLEGVLQHVQHSLPCSV